MHSVEYKGHLRNGKVKGTWIMGEYSDRFKITKELNVHHHRPFLASERPQGDVDVSTH